MSHVTRTPLSRSKGQRSRSPGRFTHRGHRTTSQSLSTLNTHAYSAPVNRVSQWHRVKRQAAAAVSVGTYWAWETTATLRWARGARRFGAHRGRRETWAYRGGRPPTACYFDAPGEMHDVFDVIGVWVTCLSDWCHWLTRLTGSL